MITYGCQSRPPMYGGCPDGFCEFGYHPDFHHGTVSYPEMIPMDIAKHFSLMEIPTLRRIDAIVVGLSDRYLSRQITIKNESQKTNYIRRSVERYAEEFNIHLNIASITESVLNRIGR